MKSQAGLVVLVAQFDERDDHVLIVYDIPYGVEKILKKRASRASWLKEHLKINQ